MDKDNPITNYMIAYDAFNAFSFSDKLLAFVKENRNFLAWTRPFEGVYLVKSQKNVFEIGDTFRSFFGNNTNHFVHQVSPLFVTGIAASETWQWIHTNSLPQLVEWAGKK